MPHKHRALRDAAPSVIDETQPQSTLSRENIPVADKVMISPGGNVGRRWMSWLLPFVVLLVGGAVTGMLISTKPEAQKQSVAERVWRVKGAEMRLGSFRPTLTLYGRVESPTLASLHAAIEADVKTVLVREGNEVAAGDILVELDGREAQQRLRQREAELEEIKALIKAEHARFANDKTALEHETSIMKLAERALERALSLQKRELASQNQTDEARQTVVQQQLALTKRRFAIKEHPARLSQLEARREHAVARVELAKLDLERTRIVAPFSGRVTQTSVAVGGRVREGDTLVELYDPRALEVRAQIPVQQMPAVRDARTKDDALSANARLDGVDVTLTLARFASSVERGRGGVDALFRVVNGEEVLQVGRVLELDLVLTPVERTLVIPREALYGTDRIYKIEDERLVAVRVVVVGEQRERGKPGNLVVSSQQVNDGDLVLVTKFANAMEGLRVSVQPSAL